MKAYLFQVAVGVDRAINAALGGSADETLSSRAHRMREKGQPVWGWAADAIDAAFFWQHEHCRQSNEYETARLKNPPWAPVRPSTV